MNLTIVSPAQNAYKYHPQGCGVMKAVQKANPMFVPFDNFWHSPNNPSHKITISEKSKNAVNPGS